MRLPDRYNYCTPAHSFLIYSNAINQCKKNGLVDIASLWAQTHYKTDLIVLNREVDRLEVKDCINNLIFLDGLICRHIPEPTDILTKHLKLLPIIIIINYYKLPESIRNISLKA